MQSNRREFIMATGGAAALGLTGRSRGAQAGSSPNDRINMGFIGLGGMGPDGCGIPRPARRQRHRRVRPGRSPPDRKAVDLVAKERGAKPGHFHDFRKLLERKDVDAVMVATPDHWHALPTVQACQAGKDVFARSRSATRINEGRAMVAAAAGISALTQLGNHIHNDLPNYRRVVELVRSGMLGDIHRVSAGQSRPTAGIGNPPDGAPPKELDYDFWLGPRPEARLQPQPLARQFRYFWDYSGGVFIDFWCHITDVAYWALDLKAPKSVAAAGARPRTTTPKRPTSWRWSTNFPAA